MRKDKTLNIIDLIAVAVFGALSLGYVLWVSDFAERHLAVPALPFPIFVGEIGLFIGLVLLTVKGVIIKPRRAPGLYLILAYVVFVVAKALWGYAHYGPLAFRHAALFYYPLFAVLGYAFYSRKILLSARVPLLVGIGVLFMSQDFSKYWLMTLCLLGFVSVLSFPSGILKRGLAVILLLMIPYAYFFNTARMMLLTNFVTGLYLIMSGALVLKIKPEYKILGGSLVLGALILGLVVFADTNALRSMVKVDAMLQDYRRLQVQIEEKGRDFVMRDLPQVQVFNDNKEVLAAEQARQRAKVALQRQHEQRLRPVADGLVREQQEVFVQEQAKRPTTPEVVLAKQAVLPPSPAKIERVEGMNNQVEVLPAVGQESSATAGAAQAAEPVTIKDPVRAAETSPEPAQERDMEVLRANAMFRILIWRDMILEMVQQKPLLGFSFGRPLRSRSLEILDWASIEWLRDGWIAAHNSFLHMVYRSGIVGLGLIFFYLALVLRMIRQAIKGKSLSGVLLCGILINWFVAANFLLILELPYTAIPIWLLFGMIYAYFYKPATETEAALAARSRRPK